MPPELGDDDDVGHRHDNDRNEEQDQADGRVVKLPVRITGRVIRPEVKGLHSGPVVLTPDLEVVQPLAGPLLAVD